MRILGIRVDPLERREVIHRIETWIESDQRGKFVSLTNVHGVMEAQRDRNFRRALQAASLCLLDGMPLVWVARARGVCANRIAGPDLMLDLCRESATKAFRHFFYGGASGVAQDLAAALQHRYPGLQVAGAYSPPFRALDQVEDDAVVEIINRSAPDLLWVGLGCPKQERWMHEHQARLNVPVMLGVGQAFDIHAGRLRCVPAGCAKKDWNGYSAYLSSPADCGNATFLRMSVLWA